ncbi:hypothetical protein HU200_023078 [Digitaria exilis]|uniref:Uncharacterized protein n=1 Tax=Digitaria exilis TaxID=1010633 RepID=A0A835EX07_9POAL|nr:hypothetical protein HU200_023078 [Digitaria exilis]
MQSLRNSHIGTLGLGDVTTDSPFRWVQARLSMVNAVYEGRMEEEGHHGVVLACSICGFLFAVLSPLSFWVLWAVNWRPWRLYRYA